MEFAGTNNVKGVEAAQLAELIVPAKPTMVVTCVCACTVFAKNTPLRLRVIATKDAKFNLSNFELIAGIIVDIKVLVPREPIFFVFMKWHWRGELPMRLVKLSERTSPSVGGDKSARFDETGMSRTNATVRRKQD